MDSFIDSSQSCVARQQFDSLYQVYGSFTLTDFDLSVNAFFKNPLV